MSGHPEHETTSATRHVSLRDLPARAMGGVRGWGRRLGRPHKADVGSGAVTGLFSIPEGMAYASIAGFNPVTGLFAGVVPAIVGSLTARTVLMVTTLTSAIALTSRSALKGAGLDPTDAGNVAALTLMVGLMMLAMGVLRFGTAMSFVSNGVMTGFSTGIALQIIVGVLKDATGYAPQGDNTLYKAGDWLMHIGSWQWTATAVATATIVVWALCRIVRRLAPMALLIAMLALTIGVKLFSIAVEKVGDISAIPSALPNLTMPDWGALPHLIPGALAVALVALAQAAGIGPTVPNPDGSRSDVNADFRSQGWANVAGGFFQSMPSGGSLSRTGVAVDAGARTRWAGVFSGVFLAVVILVAGSQAEQIPMPVIGGLILVVGGELVWGRRHDIVLVFRTSALSAIAMVATFAATTQLPLQQAVVVGAALSLILYCVQAARQARLTGLAPDGRGLWRPTKLPEQLTEGEVTVAYYAGSAFFAELPQIESQLPRVEDARNAVLVLVVRALPDVPSTTMLKMLEREATTLADQDCRLILAGTHPGLDRIMHISGLAEKLGEDGIVPAQGDFDAPLDIAYRTAREWIARNANETAKDVKAAGGSPGGGASGDEPSASESSSDGARGDTSPGADSAAIDGEAPAGELPSDGPGDAGTSESAKPPPPS